MPALKRQERRIRETSCTKCGEDSWIPNGIGYWRCAPCQVTQRQVRYKKNKETLDAKSREWALANPDKIKEIKARDRNANKNRNKLAQARWYLNNPGKAASYCAYRRANKKLATPRWFDKEEVQYIYKLAKEKGLVVDHIVPLTSKYVCGLHVQDNLRCITSELNTHKSNTYWSDM